jgi:glucoamylase
MENTQNMAPGGPGISPTWTSSAKDGVGTSLSDASRVWFSISHGILNEIYYPRVDQACIRDLGLIITNRQGLFSEEKRHTNHELQYIVSGVPAFHLTNTCTKGLYRVEKEILTDSMRDTILQRTHFTPLQGSLNDFHLYGLLAPHIGNKGFGNTAWIGEYKGHPMLFAERDGITLALASSAPWLKRSAGFVGVSDGWQDIFDHKVMTQEYSRAENGNVALTGEVDLQTSNGEFVLALGFGTNPAEAGHRALASLFEDFDRVKEKYVRLWQAWSKTIIPVEEPATGNVDLFGVSAMVIKVHESGRFPGGVIASLSIPWGATKSDDDLGGYHLAWPRDLTESAMGLLAFGANEDVVRVLRYLQVTQEPDGHWPQNMWLDGTPYWDGIQLDETAFPILLVDLARRKGAFSEGDLQSFWPMVFKAASFIVKNGPVTQQDRWEEDPGFSPFTLAVEISALLAAADLAVINNFPEIAGYLCETADTWNDNIERWTYTTGTTLARQVGVPGYYVRIAPPETADADSPMSGFVPIKNHPGGQDMEQAALIVSPDALALVRFGLRAADTPQIKNTVKVIDALLKTDTPMGPSWHRYTDDGYGEHADGSPFDGTGVGRPWPLLTGERAHYELAAGHRETAEALRQTLAAFANSGGLIPEQVWDGEDIPEKELWSGKPTGSAMPLVWAHSEYIKLCRSLMDNQVFDMPPQTVQRYIVNRTTSQLAPWRFNHKLRRMHPGKILRLEVLAPAVVHWSADNWNTVHDTPSQDTALGIYVLDLPTQDFPIGTLLTFTFYWPETDHWEGSDYIVQIQAQI